MWYVPPAVMRSRDPWATAPVPVTAIALPARTISVTVGLVEAAANAVVKPLPNARIAAPPEASAAAWSAPSLPRCVTPPATAAARARAITPTVHFDRCMVSYLQGRGG